MVATQSTCDQPTLPSALRPGISFCEALKTKRGSNSRSPFWMQHHRGNTDGNENVWIVIESSDT